MKHIKYINESFSKEDYYTSITGDDFINSINKSIGISTKYFNKVKTLIEDNGITSVRGNSWLVSWINRDHLL